MLVLLCYLQSLDISITYEIYDDLESPDTDYPLTPVKPSLAAQQSGSVGSYSSSASANDGKVRGRNDNVIENFV